MVTGKNYKFRDVMSWSLAYRYQR